MLSPLYVYINRWRGDKGPNIDTLIHPAIPEMRARGLDDHVHEKDLPAEEKGG
jgi:hypothetical protein